MTHQEVFKEMSQQTHSFIYASGMAVLNPPTVTLDADQKPFWDVMVDVCKQLNVCPYLEYRKPNAIEMLPAWGNWMVHAPHEIVGPYFISMSSLTHSRTAYYNGTSPLRDEFGGQLILLPEPKLKVTSISNFNVIEAKDDAGHSLIPSATNVPTPSMQGFERTVQFRLSYPDQPGSKISVLRGEILVTVAEDYQHYQVEDVLGTPKVTNPLEGTDIQIHVSEHADEIRVDIQGARGTLDANKWLTFESNMSNMTLEDTDGHAFVLTKAPSTTYSSESISVSTFKALATFSRNISGAAKQPTTARTREPKRLVWTFPTSVKAVKIPVTFKDIPMP